MVRIIFTLIRNVPVTPTPSHYFSKSAAVQMGGVPPYKWEAGKYGDTNGGRTAVQVGGVVPYFFDKL